MDAVDAVLQVTLHSGRESQGKHPAPGAVEVILHLLLQILLRR